MKLVNVICSECGKCHGINQTCPCCGTDGGIIEGTKIRQVPLQHTNSDEHLMTMYVNKSTASEFRRKYFNFEKQILSFDVKNNFGDKFSSRKTNEYLPYDLANNFWNSSKNERRFNDGQYSIEHKNGEYLSSYKGRLFAISQMDIFCTHSPQYDFKVHWNTKYLAQPTEVINYCCKGLAMFDGTLPIVWELGKMGWFNR